MALRYLVPILAVFSLTAPARAAAPIREEGRIQPDLLLKWIQDSAFSKKADFIAGLPEELLERQLFIKNSGSRHMGTLEYPRALLHDEDASFILGFSGHPKDPLVDTVEMFSILPHSTRWRMTSMNFASGVPTAVNADESRCVSCHGNPPRPIFSGYAFWPTSYGQCSDNMRSHSFLDSCTEGSFEGPWFDYFLSNGGQSAEYVPLVSRLKKNDRGYDTRSPYPYANTTFTARLGNRQALNVLEKMQHSPHWAWLRFGLPLVSDLTHCDHALPIEKFIQVQWQVDSLYNTLIPTTNTVALPVKNGFPLVRVSDTQRELKVLELLGINPLLDLELGYSGSGRLDRPGIPQTLDQLGKWNVGTDTLLELLQFLTLTDLLKDDEVQKIFKSVNGRIQEILDQSFRADTAKLRALAESGRRADGTYNYDVVNEDQKYYESLFPQVVDTVFAPVLAETYGSKFSAYRLTDTKKGLGLAKDYCSLLAARFQAGAKPLLPAKNTTPMPSMPPGEPSTKKSWWKVHLPKLPKRP